MTDAAMDYWRANGLDRLIALYQDPQSADPFHATAGKATTAFAPQVADLVRLHQLVTKRMAATVLEFGVGFSTVVLADALAKNEARFNAIPDRPRLRNSNLFKLFSVDASEHWITETTRRLPPALAARVKISHSPVKIGSYQGQVCHFYEKLPNVIADFIYLDAPLPKDVQGSFNGLDFSIDERTVMSGDILLLELTMLPGTFIIVDGRVNNARFLQRNFTRNFVHSYDRAGDITTFELDEPPLGRHSHDLAALVARHEGQG